MQLTYLSWIPQNIIAEEQTFPLTLKKKGSDLEKTHLRLPHFPLKCLLICNKINF